MIHLTGLKERTRGLGSLSVRHVRLLEQAGLNCLVVVPLSVRGQTVGALSFGAEDAERGFSETELALAYRLGRRCAAAIDYSRVYALAQQAMQDREDFVAATSHELRTPLSHIKGFVSTLRTKHMEWDAETRDDFLAEIEREADRLARLVENLLDMSFNWRRTFRPSGRMRPRWSGSLPTCWTTPPSIRRPASRSSSSADSSATWWVCG